MNVSSKHSTLRAGQQWLAKRLSCREQSHHGANHVLSEDLSANNSAAGRQCMASCFFLLKQFEDVLVYLKSIKTYLASDDDFNWNYGIAYASNGEWAEAEEAFGAIQSEAYRQEGPFLNWSARTFIMQGDHSMPL